MSRKHFAALANALRQCKPSEWKDYLSWVRTVKAIADACERNNVLFDRERFYRACGFDY